MYPLNACILSGLQPSYSKSSLYDKSGLGKSCARVVAVKKNHIAIERIIFFIELNLLLKTYV